MRGIIYVGLANLNKSFQKLEEEPFKPRLHYEVKLQNVLKQMQVVVICEIVRQHKVVRWLLRIHAKQ